MTRPRLLDLFCAAGGAGMGYHLAGFDVFGVDIAAHPEYPFDFVQADATEPPFDLDDFDLIHASPPCQRFSTITRTPEDWPDLIDPIRQLLAGRPHIIENVPGAGLRPDVTLCGSMFGMQLQRHRVFEIEGFHIWNPPVCNHEWENGRPWTITGDLHSTDQLHAHSYKPSFARARELMGMDWATDQNQVSEAIPPRYTKFLGSEFLAPTYERNAG